MRPACLWTKGATDMKTVSPDDPQRRLERLHELADELLAWHELVVREIQTECTPAHQVDVVEQSDSHAVG